MMIMAIIISPARLYGPTPTNTSRCIHPCTCWSSSAAGWRGKPAAGGGGGLLRWLDTGFSKLTAMSSWLLFFEYLPVTLYFIPLSADVATSFILFFTSALFAACRSAAVNLARDFNCLVRLNFFPISKHPGDFFQQNAP